MEPRRVFFDCPDDVVPLLSSPLLESMEALRREGEQDEIVWNQCDTLWCMMHWHAQQTARAGYRTENRRKESRVESSFFQRVDTRRALQAYLSRHRCGGPRGSIRERATLQPQRGPTMPLKEKQGREMDRQDVNSCATNRPI